MGAADQRCVASVKVVNELGMHARPAMAFVEIATKYQAKVTVRRGKQTVDGKSIMQMMMLAATKGAELEIEASGADAEGAVGELTGLVQRGFDE